MGFFDWVRRLKATGTSAGGTSSFTVSVHHGDGAAPDGGPDMTDPQRQKAQREQMDHLAHEVTSVRTMGPLSVNVSSSTSMFVNGQAVDPTDPRAREAIRVAVARLREQGLDELAGDLERQLGGLAASPGRELSPAGGELPTAGGDVPPADDPAADAGRETAAPVNADPDMSTFSPDEAPSAPSAPSPPAGPV